LALTETQDIVYRDAPPLDADTYAANRTGRRAMAT
jgi:hypothetical protein